MKQEKNLLDKKEKLFRSKEFGKWGYQGDGGVKEIEGKHEKLMKIKDAAFTYMLQNESRDLEIKREHLSFFTN